MNPENVLELQLGGNYESLSARLRRPPPGTAQRIVSLPEDHDNPPSTDPPEPKPPQPEITDLKPDPRLQTKPSPRRAPPKQEPEFHMITLAVGQTLYGMCKAELGSGGRWKEVAALNGWSEAQAAKLPAGQKVKLPVQ